MARHHTSRGFFRRAGFSLVELLVVIGLLSVLLTIAINALGYSGRSRSIGEAGGTVSDLAKLARENAASRNVPTALIMVPSMASDGQTYTLLSIWQREGANPPRQVDRWTLLPSTVIGANTSSNFAAAPYPTPPAISPLTFRGQNCQGAVTYWFYPDGRVGDGATTPKIRINSRNSTGDSTNNFYEIIFNPYIGTFKVNRP